MRHHHVLVLMYDPSHDDSVQEHSANARGRQEAGGRLKTGVRFEPVT